jgi:hypothetical protein
MTIRLSGAQITKIQEALDRYERNGIDDRRNSFFTPFHQRIEELVEDILKEVLPCPTSTVPIQNEQRSVNI